MGKYDDIKRTSAGRISVDIFTSSHNYHADHRADLNILKLLLGKVMNRTFMGLIEKIDSAIDGESLDDIIPVMVTFIASASIKAGVSKEIIMMYLSDALDEAHGKHDEKH